MAPMNKPMKPQELEFFKIDQGTYDPKTGMALPFTVLGQLTDLLGIWGSDTLIKQNNTWTVQIPSGM
jgi:hypothetical protein